MSTARLLADLRVAGPRVAPSLLACDFARLKEEIRAVEAAGAEILHLDIMDGHFVPNLSFGVPVVRAIRRVTELPLDVHLMLSEPGRYLKVFREAGADLLTIHIEVAEDPRPLLDEIRSLGALAGLSLNPPTPTAAVEPYLADSDHILVMSVMPGFGGQEFDPVALEKLRRLRELGGRDLILEVDGGINDETAGPCAAAGADLLVIGSALFSTDDYGRFIKDVTGLAKSSLDSRA